MTKIEEINKLIKKYVSLKVYIISLAFVSIIFATYGFIVEALTFGLYFTIGIVIMDSYKKKLNID